MLFISKEVSRKYIEFPASGFNIELCKHRTYQNIYGFLKHYFFYEVEFAKVTWLKDLLEVIKQVGFNLLTNRTVTRLDVNNLCICTQALLC